MILFFVLASITFMIFMISYYKINTFLSLFLVSIALGICLQLPIDEIFKTIKSGFGHTLEKIGLLIIFGVILGEILEKTKATECISQVILNRFGVKNKDFAVLLIGFLVGLPIFCDSGFIILSGLIFSLSQRGGSKRALVICLAGSLYAVHCLVPPHPGILAATTKLNVNIGFTMLLGSALAVIPTLAVFYFSKFFKAEILNQELDIQELPKNQSYTFSSFQAFLPLWLPILLMATKAVVSIIYGKNNYIIKPFIDFMGEPVMALLIGIFSAIPLLGKTNNLEISKIFNNCFGKSGHILAIVAAGGMFGEMVKLAIEQLHLENINFNLGIFWIFLPFFLTAFLKSAQGSSTVAIISAVSILQPLMPNLGINTEWQQQLFLMAMGAGSMMISHANDAYFWVVTNFAKQSESESFKGHSVMSALMGLSTIGVLFFVSLFV